MLTFDQARTELSDLLRAKSVFRGDFTLSSGARSNYYLDCRITTLDPKGAWLIGQTMHTLIRKEQAARNARIDAVGGLTMGADPIGLAVGMISYWANNPPLPGPLFPPWEKGPTCVAQPGGLPDISRGLRRAATIPPVTGQTNLPHAGGGRFAVVRRRHGIGGRNPLWGAVRFRWSSGGVAVAQPPAKVLQPSGLAWSARLQVE